MTASIIFVNLNTMSTKEKSKKNKFTQTFNYFEVTATCVCGSEFKTGSTQEAVRVDICSDCHPFFTGDNKIVDAEGRVERFKKKYAKYNK